MINKEEQPKDERTKYIVQYGRNLSCPINQFHIIGERHSGTNYLNYVISNNIMSDQIEGRFGHKHWIGSACRWEEYNKAQNVLFIAIVRDFYDWIGGMNHLPHHLHLSEHSLNALFNERFISWHKNDITGHKTTPVQNERNYITQAFYNNIFEARDLKNQFLYHYLPFLTDNFILINYEKFIFFHRDIVSFIKDFFKIPQRRDYRVLKDQEAHTRNKTHYNFAEEITEYINLRTNWATESLFGYSQREIGIEYVNLV